MLYETNRVIIKKTSLHQTGNRSARCATVTSEAVAHASRVVALASATAFVAVEI